MADVPRRKSLVLGTMRFPEVVRSHDEWLHFLRSVWAMGIRTLHSSSEYDSFSLVSTLLSEASSNNEVFSFRHIVKVAEPSFDDADFDADRLKEKVLAYQNKLQTAVVNDFQWMWRHDLKADGKRLLHFQRRLDAVGEAASQMKRDGLIERFFCFPYSPDFATVALEDERVDGLVVYRNVCETDYDAHLDWSHVLGKRCHVIRPFFLTGALRAESHCKRLAFALDKPAIESAILSSNSVAHLSELTSTVEACR
jgi:aryl-alcohol dehydrogenase-like predicted oxidoreductase